MKAAKPSLDLVDIKRADVILIAQLYKKLTGKDMSEEGIARTEAKLRNF